MRHRKTSYRKAAAILSSQSSSPHKATDSEGYAETRYCHCEYHQFHCASDGIYRCMLCNGEMPKD